MTNGLLQKWVLNEKEWIDPSRIKGEFNPLVGSSCWFKDRKKVQLLIPIENYEWKKPKDEWQALSLGYTSGTTGNPKGVVYHHRGAYLMATGSSAGV